MKNQKFVFEFAVRAIPYNKKTAKMIYGANYYNPDFPAYCHASQIGFTILQDALAHNLTQLSKYLAECKCEPKQMTKEQKAHYTYLERKFKATELAMDSFKFNRVEKK